MAEQPSHLTVIDGEKRDESPDSEVQGTSESIFPPIPTTAGQSNEEALEVFVARLNMNKLDRLRHKHSTDLFQAELNVEALKLEQSFELILFEASVNGVSYRTLEESHSEAAETLEAINEKVS